MQLLSHDLTKLINLIAANKVQAILFNGPNLGFITMAIEQIKEKLGYITVDYPTHNLLVDELSLVLNRRNLLQQKELIKIATNSNHINKAVQHMLDVSNSEHLLCFIADETLAKTSSVRQFFTSSPTCVIFTCYYDNTQTITKMILQQCSKQNKTIDADALSYLALHLKGDHQIIKSELNKLFLYTYHQETITLNEVQLSLSSNLVTNADEMCIFFAEQNYAMFIAEAIKIQHQNINEVLIIRALIRYFLNLYIASLQIENGLDMEHAMHHLNPPIFYKYVSSFKRLLAKYSSQQSLAILYILQSAEIKYKRCAHNFDLFTIILDIEYHHNS